MSDVSLLVQAAADTTRAYGEFPLIGARAAVWIAAEVHLMFAAFVLGVPMFAVVTEAIGIFGGDERYDRLSKEFTRLLLVAYSATAIWGAILVFFLATLYPRFWAYLTAVFGPRCGPMRCCSSSSRSRSTSIITGGTAGSRAAPSWATGRWASCSTSGARS